MPTDHPLSQAEFDHIYSRVPRLTVELVVRQNGALFLTQRAIAPCAGTWHLPGGTVRFGEPLLEAVRRIARRELGVTVRRATNIGYIEYPSHYKNGLDCPVGLVFRVDAFFGAPTPNSEAAASGWYEQLPVPMHPDQDTFLLAHKLIAAP